MAKNEIETKQPDGQIDKKDNAPMQVAHDQPTGDGSEHRAHQSGDGDEAHGADEFRLGKGPHEGEPADGHHHGSAAALQDAAGDENGEIASQTAEQRPQGEKPDGAGKYPARAETIRHPSADRNEDRQTQGITGQHRLHAEGSNRQCPGDGGDGGIENRRIERFHKESHGDEPRQHSLHGGGRRRGGGIGIHQGHLCATRVCMAWLITQAGGWFAHRA